MSFSSEWNQQYQNNQHLSVWPWSTLVSLCLKYTDLKTKPLRVLELGCGAGANIPFIQTYTSQYYAVEGSSNITDKLHKKFPQLAKNIVIGDFSKEIPFEGLFDLVLDRGAITHNNTDGVKDSLKLARDKLKIGGKLVITDWFSTESDQYKFGNPVDDDLTRTNFTSGPFQGLGKVHFFDKKHIDELITEFNLIYLQHTIHDSLLEKTRSAAWNLILEKPCV